VNHKRKEGVKGEEDDAARQNMQGKRRAYCSGEMRTLFSLFSLYVVSKTEEKSDSFVD